MGKGNLVWVLAGSSRGGGGGPGRGVVPGGVKGAGNQGGEGASKSTHATLCLQAVSTAVLTGTYADQLRQTFSFRILYNSLLQLFLFLSEYLFSWYLRFWISLHLQALNYQTISYLWFLCNRLPP